MLQPAESSWIEPLVLALYRPTIQLATLLVRDNIVAQDIVQEAFVRVWLSPRTPREMSTFRPWLYRTVVNLARDHQRRQGRWARLRFGRAASDNPMDVAERREADAALGDAVRGESSACAPVRPGSSSIVRWPSCGASSIHHREME
ncbi:MAG: RNA polymerase sigma factor [Chloroflexi bacterium]|nr:MAG: RNA polymerase sigma factor [Chloroflexota bacterium]